MNNCFKDEPVINYFTCADHPVRYVLLNMTHIDTGEIKISNQCHRSVDFVDSFWYHREENTALPCIF